MALNALLAPTSPSADPGGQQAIYNNFHQNNGKLTVTSGAVFTNSACSGTPVATIATPMDRPVTGNNEAVNNLGCSLNLLGTHPAKFKCGSTAGNVQVQEWPGDANAGCGVTPQAEGRVEFNNGVCTELAPGAGTFVLISFTGTCS